MLTRSDAAAAISAANGLLELDAALVARSWIAPGRRLGLADDEYEVGERGWLSERWLASTTRAANAVTVEGEGVSVVRTGGGPVRLDELVAAAPDLVMGAGYAATHSGLGRLAKIFDYGDRVPFHIHPPTEQAHALGLQSKDEAYYFLPGVDLGPHPESFFGVHAALEAEEAGDRLVSHLRRWADDRVLELSLGYRQYPEGGYFVPSGVLHAPGTALTLELQEDSDAMAFLQATCGDVHLSKDLLTGMLDPRAVRERGEAAILDWVDWDLNRLPDFHSLFHLDPVAIRHGGGVDDDWLFWGGTKFAAKRLRLAPGASVHVTELGTYSVFVWTGQVAVGERALRGGSLTADELLVTYDRAVGGLDYRNVGTEPAELIRFFGPDLTPDAPVIDARAGSRA